MIKTSFFGGDTRGPAYLMTIPFTKSFDDNTLHQIFTFPHFCSFHYPYLIFPVCLNSDSQFCYLIKGIVLILKHWS